MMPWSIAWPSDDGRRFYGSRTIFQPVASQGIGFPTPTTPIADAACGMFGALRLRFEFATPEARSVCEPVARGVRRARFGL